MQAFWEGRRIRRTSAWVVDFLNNGGEGVNVLACINEGVSGGEKKN